MANSAGPAKWPVLPGMAELYKQYIEDIEPYLHPDPMEVAQEVAEVVAVCPRCMEDSTWHLTWDKGCHKCGYPGLKEESDVSR